jgi:hypothetical protein
MPGLLLVFELTAEHHGVAGGHVDLAIDTFTQLFHQAAHVTPLDVGLNDDASLYIIATNLWWPDSMATCATSAVTTQTIAAGIAGMLITGR